MRLRTLNRLSQVSSAVVTTLLVGAGCHLHKAPNTAPVKQVHPATMTWISPATTTASTEPATQASTEPATLSSTLPATLPSTLPSTLPATLPRTLPSTQATTQAATEPTTEPAAPPVADEPLPKDAHQIDADAALAEQIDSIAELEFANKISRAEMWPLIWRHQAALLSACATLHPSEARFPRLIADTMVQLHDREGELEALRKAIVADYNDEVSWNRRLDLILVPMQSAREKVDYLRDVMSRTTSQIINGVPVPPVPPDVRAHAAFRCAQLLLERGEEEGASAALTEALRTCPSNLECLTLRYQLLAPDAPRFERCEQLLDLLHANPLQQQYSMKLADLVADSGLVQESLPWYQLAVSTAHLQQDPARHSMLNWAAELYIGDENIDALRLNSALLHIDPTYTPAYFLQLVMTRSSGDKDSYTKTLKEASNALSNRVVEACNQLAPKDTPKATTRPISDEFPLKLPDLSVAIAQIKQEQVGPTVTPQNKQQFIEAVADLALLEAYFAADADAASKLTDALSGIVPDNAPELARLRGWNDVLAKKPDEAKTKFATVAAQDPLAELGLIKIMLDNPAERTNAESLGRRLLQDHPSGLLGAMLWEQLRSARVKLITTTQADALRAALAEFPISLLKLVDKPQSIYAIHVEPRPLHSYVGEPLLARVSVQNISDYDLTIGPDGVLKSELLFMLYPKVGNNPSYSAFDTLAGPTVLASHTAISQTVRVDQTPLLAFLNTQTNMQFEVDGSLTTNETARGLGGYPVKFEKKFFRLSSVLNPANQQSAEAELAQGRPEQKITALNLLERFAAELEKTKNPEMQVQQQIVEMVSAIHHARSDSLLSVSAWAGQCEFHLVNPADRVNILRDLAEDDDWRHRQMALLLVNGLEPALRDQIVAKLATDTQSSVRAEATALRAFIALPPEATTQPTTAPATSP